MEKYEIIITINAQNQIKSICNYIAVKLYNQNAALSFLELLQKEIKTIALFPEAYPFIDREPWKSKSVRRTIVKSFIVYFLFNKELNRISVLAVIYGKRDQLQELKKLDF